MIRYARCEHCGQKVKVIKKENYDEVEDIIYNLKKDGEKYILEEGPRYSNEIEWKENAYGEIEMIRHSDEALRKADKDAEELEKKYERKMEQLGLDLSVIGSTEMINDKKHYYGYVYTWCYNLSELENIICEGEHECPRCKKDALFNPEDSDLSNYDKRVSDEYVVQIKSKYRNDPLQRGTVNNKTKINVSEYLTHLINVGKDVYLLEEKLRDLIKSKTQLIRLMNSCEYDNAELTKSEKNQKMNEYKKELEKKIAKAKKRYEKAVDISDDKVKKLCEANNLKEPTKPEEPLKPIEPKKPIITIVNQDELIEPEKPILEEAKFFNKKAVKIRNQNMMNEYEISLKNYNEAVKRDQENKQSTKSYDLAYSQYQDELQKYNSNFKEYQAIKKEYDADLEIYQKEKASILEREVKKLEDKKGTKIKNEIQGYETALKDFEVISKKDTDKALLEIDEWYKPAYLETVFVNDEISDCEEKLKEEYKVLNEIFSVGIIYPKYNNLIAWTTIYEYFETGRVNALEGPDGAYNLYESEIRANIIIGKLDVIIDKLEQIKDNQYMLYQIMESVNENLCVIRDGIKSINESMKTISYSLSNTNDLLGEINNNANVIKYNTAKTAEYAKMTANGTKALVFLKAMFG